MGGGEGTGFVRAVLLEKNLERERLCACGCRVGSGANEPLSSAHLLCNPARRRGTANAETLNMLSADPQSCAVALLCVLLGILYHVVFRRTVPAIGVSSSAQRLPCEAAAPSMSPKGPGPAHFPRARKFARSMRQLPRDAARSMRQLPRDAAARLTRPRSASTPPVRSKPIYNVRIRALSPNVRVKQRFGQHVANALGEGHMGRVISPGFSADGLRLSRDTWRRRMLESRATLPKFHTNPNDCGVEERLLPSDAAPWERLHVWLVAGEDLPYRPWFWPYEPYVLLTVINDDLSSVVGTESYEFQTAPEFSSATTPVWDEQGMVCYRRDAARSFQVVVMSAAKPWSGLYHVRALRPRALIAVLLAALIGMLGCAVRLPLAIRRCWSGRMTASPPTNSPAAATVASDTAAPAAAIAATTPAATAAVRAASSPPTLQTPADDATRVTFELPPPGGDWMDVRVPLHTDCGGSIHLRVRVTGWECRPVAPEQMPPRGRHARSPPSRSPPSPARKALADSPLSTGSVGSSIERSKPPSPQPSPLPSPQPPRAVSADIPEATADADQVAAIGAAILPPPRALSPPADDGMLHMVLSTEVAVLSYYPTPPSGEAALLWLPGRNDAFFHPHVARLLAEHGIDLYVLSYRRMGVCRRLGLFDNPMHNSHCASGDVRRPHTTLSPPSDPTAAPLALQTRPAPLARLMALLARLLACSRACWLCSRACSHLL